MSTCLITGCALVCSWDGAWVWGDLHEVAGCYVFNGVRGKTGFADWHYQGDGRDNAGQRALRVLSGEASVWLELQGVIIVPKMNAELNDVALKYIEEGRKL